MDSSCSVAILVLFILQPYFLPKRKTEEGVASRYCFWTQCLRLATLLCISAYKRSGWAKQEIGTCLIKLLVDWHLVDLPPTEKKWVVLVLKPEFPFLTAWTRKRSPWQTVVKDGGVDTNLIGIVPFSIVTRRECFLGGLWDQKSIEGLILLEI